MVASAVQHSGPDFGRPGLLLLFATCVEARWVEGGPHIPHLGPLQPAPPIRPPMHFTPLTQENQLLFFT